MRIAEFWAEGFRSLRDVRLTDLGPYNIFYGPNGSGKSNILVALDRLMKLAKVAAHSLGKRKEESSGHSVVTGQPSNTTPSPNAVYGAPARPPLIGPDDLSAYSRRRLVKLGAKLVAKEGDLYSDDVVSIRDLKFEVTLDWSDESQPLLFVSKFAIGGHALDLSEVGKFVPPAVVRGKQLKMAEVLPHLRSLLRDLNAYALVDADRFPRAEARASAPASDDVVAILRDGGGLKHALLVAQTHRDSRVRARLQKLKNILEGPPLHRPPFTPVTDPVRGPDIRELLPEPNPEGRDVPIDFAGLGIANVYYTLAYCLFLGVNAVGIEEPEAHLHAPTNGRHLRELLVRLVDEHHVEQLFIATHSNLFDLDPERYYDVSLDANNGTSVQVKDVTQMDRHYYEPGPAKHALQRMLRAMPETETVFRTPDGDPVTAREMLEMLQRDDELAVRFLEDVHGVAVHTLKVRADRRPA